MVSQSEFLNSSRSSTEVIPSATRAARISADRFIWSASSKKEVVLAAVKTMIDVVSEIGRRDLRICDLLTLDTC